MVICPNCYGRRCQYCKEFGPFGFVPEGVDVEIVLMTGKTAEVPEGVRVRRALGEWLLGDGGADEMTIAVAAARSQEREVWDGEDNDG